MKRILTLSFAALLLAGSSMAQETKKTGKEKANKEWKHHGKQARHGKHDKAKAAGMAKELNLTEAQKQEMKALKQDYKAKSQALRQERKAKAENILTAEQKAKMARMKQDRKDQGHRKDADRMGKMQKELNLTEVQGQRIKAINESFRDRAKAIRDNQSLTQEQKKEQFKALNEQRKNELKSVLTAEQIRQMESKQKEFQDRKPRKGRK